MAWPYAHVLNVLLPILLCVLYIDNYTIDIRVCMRLGPSLSQTVRRTAEDLSRTQAIRICDGHCIGTGFLRVHRISPVGIITPVFRVRPSSVTENE